MLAEIAGKDKDMFDVGAHILINPVNCIGIMGGGLAKVFKDNYSGMYHDYLQQCDRGFKPGMIHTYQELRNLWIFNVPTKDDLSDSTIQIVKTSLVGLMITLVAMRPVLARARIAMPALGCGLGGLDWEEVKPLLVQFCSDPRLADYEFILFEPQ